MGIIASHMTLPIKVWILINQVAREKILFLYWSSKVHIILICSQGDTRLRYELDVRDLKIKEFALDEEWLKYVIKNRNEDYTISAFDDSEYDVLIGATVDDKMSRIVDLYYEGMISINRAIDEFNHMQYSRQIVLKTDAAINKLTYLD